MNPNNPENPTIRNIRRLIWLYFWLLLLEGALRKWVVPQLSNPLLIIRDPVVLLIYVLALRARVFPRNGWVFSLAVIAFLSLAVSFIALWPYLPPSRIFLVSGYGFRANFLHLPLIFLMPRVLRPEDVKRIGWWVLIILVPMSLLMVAQFRAAPDALLNRTASGEGEMMTAALGKVRTAATFSFVVGVVAYFALATGFLVWAALKRGAYKNWVLFAGGSALLIGIAVSGSRSVVGACVVVVASLLVVLFLRPSAVNRFGQALLVTVVLGFIVTQTPVFKEGVSVLSARFSAVAEAEEQSIVIGLISRVFDGFSEAVRVYPDAPFFGYGLGIGTNAGAKFLTGQNTFLLAEGEWARLILESGPVLGLAFVLWRCAVVVHIGLLCLRSVRRGNVLPLLLFSSGGLPLMNGQFGPPTVLGFAVFTTGLALAARNADDESEIVAAATVSSTEASERVVGRRSAYADRMHGPAAPRNQSNGSVDR
ncbi:MAG: hypothetical protein QOC70_1991 [Verrucomicrobiota bacterium]|jgi:hypothetical protein